MHTAKKILIGLSQFAALMFVLLFLVRVVTLQRKDTSELSSGIHTKEIAYLRVIIHDSSAGALQFETEDHILYAIPIVGAQPTALKPGQFANVHLRQIFEVKSTEDEKNRLYAGSFPPCTPQTPCALFLQAELIQKNDKFEPRNTIQWSVPMSGASLRWH